MTQRRAKFTILLSAYFLFSAVLAGAELNMASAVGYNLIPLSVSYFIIKSARTSKHFLVASVIVISIFAAMNMTSIKSRYDKNTAVVYNSCFDRNASVALMATVDEKEKFCRCFSNKISAFAMLQDAKIFYNLVKIEEARQSPISNSFLNDAFMQCGIANS